VSAVTTVPVALTGEVYGLVPGSWPQVFWLTLLPQLVVWPPFTVLVGALGAKIVGWLPRPASAATRARA